MKIYKISWQDNGVTKWDAYCGHAIVANTKKEVRELAKSKYADEGAFRWDRAKIEVLGEYTGKRKTPFIFLSDFNAG